MHDTLLHTDGDGLRRWMLVLEIGDDPYGAIAEFAAAEDLTAASVSGIGALSTVTFGWFDPDARDYDRTTLDEQVEVTSLVGNVTVDDGEPFLHAHITVTSRGRGAVGGHLFGGRVEPTLEVTVAETPAALHRTQRPEIGLALSDAGAGAAGSARP